LGNGKGVQHVENLNQQFAEISVREIFNASMPLAGCVRMCIECCSINT